MNVSYHKWLEIEVLHSYFEKDICRDISIIPLGETVKKLENYNILFRNQENVFSFFAGIKADHTFAIAEVFEGLEDLNFQLVTQDPVFFNYTNLTPLFEDKIYYFSSEKESETDNSLHNNTAASEQELVAFSPKKFDQNIEDGVTSIDVTNSQNETAFTANLEGSPESVIVDLSPFDDGVYNIKENGNLKKRVFCTDDRFNAGAIGVINLNIKSILDNSSGENEYTIRFNAREVFWQYQVVVPMSRNLEVHSMEIKGMADEIYDGPEKITIVGGEDAGVYTSNIPMALRDKTDKNPVLLVSYSGEHSNRTDDLELKLPLPNSEQLKIFNTGENEGSFYSTTIIYV